jgi:hypothetical protein
LTAITDDIKHPNGDEFKAAMRNDPGYKKIIKIEAERCFAGKNIRTVVSNILQVVNSSDIAPAVKQDFLNSVLNYAKSRNVVLPGDNAEYFRGLADGFLELKGNP